MSKKLIFLISLCLVLGLAGNASATIMDWDDGGPDHLWKTAMNWDPNEVPVTPNIATVDNPGAICIIDSTHVGTAAANPYWLQIGWEAGPATVDVNGGQLEIPYRLQLGNNANGNQVFIRPGSYVEVADRLDIGRTTDATLTMTGGTLDATYTTQTHGICLGWGSAFAYSKGVLDVSSGTVHVLRNIHVGRSPNPFNLVSGRPDHVATLKISGDAVINVTEDVHIGSGGGSDLEGRSGRGMLEMTGGLLNITRDFAVPGTSDPIPAQRQYGWAFLDGGTIQCDNFTRLSDANLTEINFIDDDADGNTGLLIVSGNKLAQVSEWVSNNWIRGYWSDDPRNVAAEYDSDTGKTTIWGVHPDDVNYAIAYSPMPADLGVAVADMSQQILLSWQPGSYVGDPNGHDVYFGESFDDVNQASRSYDPCGVYKGVQDYADLDYGPVNVLLDKAYYWRVDEIDDANDDSPWKGDVWTLDVPSYLIVDEFEQYDATGHNVDYGDANLRDTWDDWWADDMEWTKIYLERGIKKGFQSMMINYQNDGTIGPGYYSETRRTYDPNQDWTTGGVKGIALSFYGDIDNTIEENENLYVYISDGTVEKAVNCDCEPNDLTRPEWQECNIALEDFTGVDMNEVSEVGVGIGDRTGGYTGSTGDVYIDNIRLHQTRCVPKYAQREDFSGDCITGYKDLDIMTDDWLIGDYNLVLGLVGRYEFEEGSGSTVADTSGKGHDGALWDMNTATCWVAGKYGSYALEFDPNKYSPPDPCGIDCVVVPACDDHALVERGITWAAWIKTSDDSEKGPGIVKREDPCGPASDRVLNFRMFFGYPYLQAKWQPAFTTGGTVISDGTWHHVAATVEFNTDGNNDLFKLYTDGDPNGSYVTVEDIQKYEDPGYGMTIGKSDVGEKAATDTGTLDDVQIYNRPLSAAEIVTVMGGGTAPDVDVYFPPGRDNIPSVAELYSEEAVDYKIINFRDYAFLVDDWLEETVWP